MAQSLKIRFQRQIAYCFRSAYLPLVNMGKAIALVAGSFKPYTAGHHFLISQAASTADQVILFVSNKDRARPGELPVVWKDSMELVWKQYIEKILPKNVKVKYVGVPVREIYEYLAKAEEAGSTDNLYIVYSDAEDLVRNYPAKSLMKYFPTLAKAKRIALRPFERGIDSPDVSGTMLRRFIQSGDIENFAANLPSALQGHAKKIINLIMRGSKSSAKNKK